jgi:hypothetical protein
MPSRCIGKYSNWTPKAEDPPDCDAGSDEHRALDSTAPRETLTTLLPGPLSQMNVAGRQSRTTKAKSGSSNSIALVPAITNITSYLEGYEAARVRRG